MLRLASVMHTITGSTLAGIMVIAVLVAGYDTLNYILMAAGFGALAGIPAAYFVAKTIKATE